MEKVFLSWPFIAAPSMCILVLIESAGVKIRPENRVKLVARPF